MALDNYQQKYLLFIVQNVLSTKYVNLKVEDVLIVEYITIKTGEMISGFVPSQLKEARLLANFRFIFTTPTELGAAVLTFVRHDMD